MNIIEVYMAFQGTLDLNDLVEKTRDLIENKGYDGMRIIPFKIKIEIEYC